MRQVLLCSAMVATIFFVAGICAAENPAKENPAAAQFDRLKKMAGNWTGKASHGPDGEIDATVSYQITSGGSAVIEKLFGGTDHEMVTMYHLNGDALILTHYCTLGNQPRMKAQPSENTKRIEFKFLDGTNMDASKDMHMHEAVLEFTDNDHLIAEWTSFQEGKPMMKAKFKLTRQK